MPNPHDIARSPHGITRCTPETTPAPAEVERLYAAASAPPPLNEPPSVAVLFAKLYAAHRNGPDTVVLTAREGTELLGIVYAHPWAWSEGDPWGRQLRERLGEAHRELDDSCAVPLLAVHPQAGGRGLGAALVRRIAEETPGRVWLQTTDADTPARRLYLRQGWRQIGFGPHAPDGRPGAVFVRRTLSGDGGGPRAPEPAAAVSGAAGGAAGGPGPGPRPEGQERATGG